MRQITKEFLLDENYSIEIIRNELETLFYRKDNKLKHKICLAVLSNDRKWEITPGLNWWELVKQYPGIIKNNIYKEMPFSYEITLNKQFNCFKRRVSIRIMRLLNRIKYLK